MNFGILNKKEESQIEVKIIENKDVFDLSTANKKFEPHIIKLNNMKITAENHKVIDNESNKTAIEMASQVKKLHNSIETTRKEIVEKPKQFSKSIDKFCKPYKDVLKSIEINLKRKITSFAEESDRKQRKIEEQARKKQLELQRKLNKEAKQKQKELEEIAKKEAEEKGEDSKKIIVPVVQPVQAVIPVFSENESITRTAEGTASLKKKWVFEIKNIVEVVKYLTENSEDTALQTKLRIAIQPTINAIIKSGIREIPGLNIFQENDISIRVN